MSKLFVTICVIGTNISFIFVCVVIKIVVSYEKVTRVTNEVIQINEKLGDFFVDIAKLVFAGVVLSTLLDMAESKGIVLFVGTWSTLMLCVIGFIMYDKVNFYKRRR